MVKGRAASWAACALRTVILLLNSPPGAQDMLARELSIEDLRPAPIKFNSGTRHRLAAEQAPVKWPLVALALPSSFQNRPLLQVTPAPLMEDAIQKPRPRCKACCYKACFCKACCCKACYGGCHHRFRSAPETTENQLELAIVTICHVTSTYMELEQQGLTESRREIKGSDSLQ